MKKIEIEARSFITEKEYNALIKKLDKKAKFIDDFEEKNIYFSGPKDLRIRSNGKQAYIILKEGKVHDDFREEVQVKCAVTDFNKLEELFKKLGYKVEIRWFRKRRIYQWDDIKVSIDDNKGYGFIIELEKIGKVGEEKKIHQYLENKLKSFGIKITPKKIFNQKFKYYKNNWQKILNF